MVCAIFDYIIKFPVAVDMKFEYHKGNGVSQKKYSLQIHFNFCVIYYLSQIDFYENRFIYYDISICMLHYLRTAVIRIQLCVFSIKWNCQNQLQRVTFFGYYYTLETSRNVQTSERDSYELHISDINHLRSMIDYIIQ